MKLIDVLVRKENGSLPDGFAFEFEDIHWQDFIWVYDKATDYICAYNDLDLSLSDEFNIENCLSEEIVEICEETELSNIEKLPEKASPREIINKINEIIDYIEEE